ncbi:MAG: 4-hydroxy-tetrahydrodipicolinate reductase [Clostridiales bacterium]|nr:4-hydroxy-tetrahydrodipicolinate reductase [Clostridiales bacterium]
MKIILHGYAGRLGSVIAKTAEEYDGIDVAAGVDISPPQRAVTYPVFTSLEKCDVSADAIIEASAAAAVPTVAAYAQNRKLPLVVCTTGLSDETERQIVKASLEIPIFKSANMSLGINLLMSILSKYAPVLNAAGFDMEIVEKHHNQKLDAPSGTALMLADTVNSALNNSMTYTVDRTSLREKRAPNEIGLHSVRGGSIVGEHTVIFAGRGEVIELTHSAQSKEIFAVGALRAAEFIAGQAPGLYNMKDLMEN